jgi:hypothetical protein
MWLLKKLILSVSLLSLATITTANPILHYEPTVVKLSGTIIKKTYPGPPNYESIKNGDAREDGIFLKLDQPFDVIVSSKDDP